MKIKYHNWWSNNLNRKMELKVYGHAGIPILIFPCSSGRFFDFENQKMLQTIENQINMGQIYCIAVDSVDPETWDNKEKTATEIALRHDDYHRYIVEEVVPFIHNISPDKPRIITSGASMGASHAVLFFLKRPDIFGGTIALSGVYNFRFFINNYTGNDLGVYYNSPLDFFTDLDDTWYIDLYRNSKIYVCVGQGAWEDPMIDDTLRLKQLFEQKNIPAFVDIWGKDVNHDWPWWRIQFPYFIEKLLAN